MAIFHFSVKVISRASGRSAVAAAAYRSASRLHDERLDRHHDFSNKAGVVHSEILLPDGASEEFADRAKLWNAVEAAEKRIDAQLAREIEFAIPRELTEQQGIDLARDFVQREFVDHSMIADLNVHWDVGADGRPKPHAHVMLAMREVAGDGFGAKVRDWNSTERVEQWREHWAEHVNARLAELDIDARIDHRSLEHQGIDLEPQHKIGPAAARMAAQGLESERLEDHRAIAWANGEKLLANPARALDAITHHQATFTRRDLAMFIHRHSFGQEQFDKVMAVVRASPELVALGKDGRGEERFTSRDMIETEQRLERAADRLAGRRDHGLPAAVLGGMSPAAGSGRLVLGDEQRAALDHIVRGPDLAIVIGYAGTGKSAMLGLARDQWEQAGYRVQGLALSGIAAENLESGSGIASRTIASIEHQWRQGRELLSANDILVIDEAGMIGTRQMERVIAEAEKRRAKIVLVGDPEQLQAIDAGAAFRAIHERNGGVEITEIRRQHQGWQRDATRQLATGRSAQAIAAYRDHGAVHAAASREEARRALIERWDRARRAYPQKSRIILSHTRDEVRALNDLAREKLHATGQLGAEVSIATTRGTRAFARGDRIMFLRNERSLGVKNGSLGRIASVDAVRMSVLLDDGRSIGFDVKDYADIDHGYAATIHKAQGVTVDRTHVLATPGLDRHATYVALSRHRESVELHYGADDFADERRLVRTLSRERAKDMASDHMRSPSTASTGSGQASLRRAFADRRAIRLSKPPEPARPRDIFAGLELAPVPSNQPAHNPQRALRAAVERFGRTTAAIMDMRRLGLDELPDQHERFVAAARALNALQPDAAHDLRSAFARDRLLIDDAVNGRADKALGALQWERRYRIDPEFRAEYFVKEWRRLDRERDALKFEGHFDRADKVTEQMGAMAKSLERDAQVESLLRRRPRELRLEWRAETSLSHDLQDWLGISRSRGIGR